MRTRILLGICLTFLSGCSFLRIFWVEGEINLTQCPPADFEFPERAVAGEGMVVAKEAWTTYCHGFTSFDLYRVEAGTKFLDVGSPDTAGEVYARIERGSTCKLHIIASVRCKPNQPERFCKEENWPNVSNQIIKDAVAPYAHVLLHKSRADVAEVSRFEIVGFDDDLPKWCHRAAEARSAKWR